MSHKIVLIKNDLEYGQILSKILNDHGYETVLFGSGIEYLTNCEKYPCDLIISSYMLRNMDGESLFKEIRDIYPEVPVIFLFDERDVSLIASLLKYTNCDVMVKPVVTEELLARVKVMLTPLGANYENDSISIKDLILNIKSKTVVRGSKNIALTPKEFSLLEYLLSNKNTVLSRNSILNKVWGTTTDVSDRVVDVYIGYLREKIDNGNTNKIIETVPGFGYVIKAE